MSPNSLLGYPTREHLKTPQNPADHIYMELKYGGRGERLRHNLYCDLDNLYGNTELGLSLNVYAQSYAKMLTGAKVVDVDAADRPELDRNSDCFYIGSLLGVRAFTADLARSTRSKVLEASCSGVAFDEAQQSPVVSEADIASWAAVVDEAYGLQDKSVRQAVNRVAGLAYGGFDPMRRWTYIRLFTSGFAYAADQVKYLELQGVN